MAGVSPRDLLAADRGRTVSAMSLSADAIRDPSSKGDPRGVTREHPEQIDPDGEDPPGHKTPDITPNEDMMDVDEPERPAGE